MRLTFIITITLCINASASVYSQATKLSVELNNSSLVEVINVIKGQSEFGFLYNIEEIKDVKNLNVDLNDATVEEILDQVLENYDLDYKIVNNVVVIMPSPDKVKNQAEELLQSEQDQRTIKGKVTEENGDPMIGVTVLVKGTNVGVATNMNGEYTINVPEGYATLLFTFIGMEDQEVEISGPVLNVTLVAADLAVDEVVVTAMGIKREKKALGYAMSKITAEEITLTGNPVNPLTSLYGKAAGVRISGTSTGPSGGVNIKIRNSVALMSGTNTRPLFVVDGVIIADQNTGIGGNTITGMDRGTGINDINGDDIESIEILKGAKAALLYGSEGANGVILISTKTGKKQKGFGVSVSFSHLFHSLGVTPEFQDEFGSGYPQWWTGAQNYANDDGFKLNGDGEEMFWGTSLSFGPKMDGREIRWWDKDENGDNVLRPYSPQPNNYNELFQKGHTTNTSVSLSNSSDIGSYRISFSNQDYKGIHMGFNQKRNSFNLNSNLKLSDRVRMTFISSVSRNVNHNSPFQSGNAPTYGLNRDLKIQELWVDNYKTEDGYWNQPTGQHWSNTWTISNRMLWQQLENENDETRDHLIQTVGLNVELTDWLSLNARAGVDYTTKLLEYKEYAWRPWDKGATGRYRRQKSSTIYTNSDVFLNFDKQINDDFRIDGLIGGTYQQRDGDSGYSQTRGFNVENWFSISNSRDTPAQNSATRWSEIMYSTLFSATLSYKNYLFVEVQGRKDWSSILPPENNSYFYPGASVSWIASENLSLPEWVKFGKLRAAWADVGRPGPRYFANNTYGWGSYNGVITNDPPSSLPAVALQPERKREFEIGFEANLFKNNRVGIDFSYYHNNVYDQIMSLPISQATGASSVKVNAGNIQHDGFELQLITKPIISNNFNWDLILNFAKDKTMVKALAKGITETALWGGIGVKVSAEVDEPYGQLYFHPYRKDDNGNRVVDDSGYGHVIERDEWELKGSVVPSIIGGISNTLRYKAFSLNFSIDYQFGAYMVSTTNMYMIGNGSSVETLKYRNEEHGGLPYYVDGDFNIIELSDHNATVPSDSRDGKAYHDGMILDGVKADGSINDQVVSSTDYYTTYWESWMHMKEDILYKTDYIKLRQLVLSYDIPQQIITKAGIQALQVSFVADNPWLIYTTLPNVDPEAYDGTNTYSERSQFPSMKSYGFAVKLSF